MLTQFFVASFNHVLRGESWALKRLAPFAGRTAEFDIAPFHARISVRESGEIATAPAEAVPDVRIRFSPPLGARILAGDASAYDEVHVEGDGDFAQALQFVVRNARWDAEEDLARVVGDAAAHRIAAAGRAALRLPAQAAASFARNLTDYWLEERPLIARRSDVADFVREVDILRDDVERLAQRLARL